MSFKLTEMQRELLGAGAKRQDRLLSFPPHLKGGAVHNVAAKLIAAGLVKEVKAKTGSPVWRKGGQSKQAYSLKLTTAGLNEAAGAEPTQAAYPDGTKAVTKHGASNRTSPSRSQDLQVSTEGATAADARRPRRGSKLDRIVGMLADKKGATLEELIKATGWLSHTARAALTGLRKRGYDVSRSRGEKGGSVYRVTMPARGSES